jgi:hypothetical protein
MRAPTVSAGTRPAECLVQRRRESPAACHILKMKGGIKVMAKKPAKKATKKAGKKR